MSDEIWYHGRVNRQQSEELLLSAAVDGSFVVRASESRAGAYALSVLFNNSVHTYRILPTENSTLAVQTVNGVQQRKFKSLTELVHEYRNIQNGLVCGLSNPVGLDSKTRPSTSPAFDSTSAVSRLETLPATPPSLPTTPRGTTFPALRLLPTPIPRSQSNTTLAGDKQRELPSPPIRETPSRAETASKETIVQNKLVTRLRELQSICPGLNTNFMELVSQYTTDGGLITDMQSVKRGVGQCAQLQTLLAKEALVFQSELENFLTKIDILRQLFDLGSPPRKPLSSKRVSNEDVDLDTFLGRLGDCGTVVKTLNKRACINLQEMLGVAKTGSVAITRKPSRVSTLSERIFEVKLEGALTSSKQKLKVNASKGKLTIVKGEGSVEYDHSQVLQIVKNNKSKSKLGVVLEGHKKRDYIFDKSSLREVFCQLMQHVRNTHNTSAEPDCISIFCGSWNMGDAIPPNEISSWFLCSGSGKILDDTLQAIPHDIYVVGTQETGLPEKEWMHKVHVTIQDITNMSFHLVAMDALWHIKILIFVKEEHKHRVSHVKTSSVKTGIANALGNKGAVGVSFQFGGTSFCFINAHLTSGAEKCARRNQNYHDISRSLNLGEDRFSVFDLANRFDHLYFLGDLNYRLEMEATEIFAHIQKKEYPILYKVDQLRREKELNKAFAGYCEEEICFPPTYRYERGTREAYSHLKVKKTGIRINVPSWCDRVLWRSYPETHNVCLAYGCSDDIMSSDHSPLFSNFQVGVRGQYVSNEEIRNNPSTFDMKSTITFEYVEVILKVPGKTSFFLQFYSVCLNKPVRSSRNTKFDTHDLGPNHARIKWNKESIEQLEPIISDKAFLVDQHILVAVRAEDDNEVHAECVIALRSMIGTEAQPFEERLTRRGEESGQIRGRMHVKARESTRAPREKTYDFIQIGGPRDEEGRRIKSQIIPEAAYADLNEIQQQRLNPTKPNIRPRAPSPNRIIADTPSTQLTPEVAVYGETENDAVQTSLAPPRGHLNPPQPVINRSISGPPASTTTISTSPNFNNLLHQFSADPPVVPQRVTITPRNTNAPVPAPRPKIPSARNSPNRNSSSATVTNVLDDALAEFEEMQSILNQQQTNMAVETMPFYMNQGNQAPTFSHPTSHNQVKLNQQIPQTVHASSAPSSGRITPVNPRLLPPLGGPRVRSAEVSSPSTVTELLSILRLQHYAPALQENGWDSIEFIGDITEEDLHDSGITNPQHCRSIIDLIQTLSL
ncbi:phosphatidylinositol 3,4,5-trisphosphate 5-phosphatase 2 [Ciona intestinalis]